MTAPCHLTATGAAEAVDLDLDRGLHVKTEGFAGHRLCKSSPGAYMAATQVTKVLTPLTVIQHITKKSYEISMQRVSVATISFRGDQGTKPQFLT